MASEVTMTDLQWKQCASGQYERSMDEIEEFYTFMASQTAALKREQGSITAAFKIAFKSSDITAAAQEAWKTLRYDHPTLASTVEGDKKVYRVADEEELNQWLKTTFIVNDHSATSRELYSTLRPVKQITLHVLLKSHELVLQVLIIGLMVLVASSCSTTSCRFWLHRGRLNLEMRQRTCLLLSRLPLNYRQRQRCKTQNLTLRCNNGCKVFLLSD